ncbi:MAG: hypothetical protein RLZZ69_3287 [Cyanobacteriota bacterium]
MAQKLTFEDIKFIEKQFNLGLRPKAIIDAGSWIVNGYLSQQTSKQI